MSKITKLTEEYFWEVKRSLGWMAKWTDRRPSYYERIAKDKGISLKTVLQVRNSKDYEEYQQQNKAQHPTIKFSLRDHVLELHKTVFDNKDNKYIPPRTAKTAIIQLEFKLAENK